MKSDILVFGGRSRPNAHQYPAWDRYEAAVLLKLRDGAVVERFEYQGWELDREVGLSIVFRAASLDGNYAYTCTSTQVLKIDLRTFTLAGAYTHRLFNDLHHVVRIGEHFYVAATGTDSVLEMDAGFELITRHPVTADELMERHGHDADFRRIPTTKPHVAHPNYVAAWGDNIWVTNFEAGRVQSLTDRTRSFHVSENRIHDGILERGHVWFTSVNGAVIKLDPATGQTETFELAPMTPTDRQLGWCRSVGAVSDTEVVVGFSKIRETKLRENLKWLGNKLLNMDYALCEPTRIAGYDLAKKTETWRFDLDAEGVNAVFSLHLL